MICKDGSKVLWKVVSQVKEEVDVGAATIKNKSSSEIHQYYALEWRKKSHPPCENCEKKLLVCQATHDNALRCVECAKTKRKCSLFIMCAIDHVAKERGWTSKKAKEIYSVKHKPLDSKRKRSSLLDSDSEDSEGLRSTGPSTAAKSQKKQKLCQGSANGARPLRPGELHISQPGDYNTSHPAILNHLRRQSSVERVSNELQPSEDSSVEGEIPSHSDLRQRNQALGEVTRCSAAVVGLGLPKTVGFRSFPAKQNHPVTSKPSEKHHTQEVTVAKLSQELENERNKSRRAIEALALLREEIRDFRAEIETTRANEGSMKAELDDKNMSLLSVTNQAIRLWQIQAPQFLEPLQVLLKNTYKRVKHSASTPGDKASSEELRQAVLYLEGALKECYSDTMGEQELERLKMLAGKPNEEFKHRLETYYAECPEMFGPGIEAALESASKTK
ncbi:hypothetical protein V5O48_004404 [Marasmius crinis-equi]|uniref:Zn(2)-C6 fungal-type domain-containing protein n=1 Tax=Marasmius crinis-equi TaxID=585013 RepID=A0ABR3FQ63_9AGAR